MPQIPSPDSSTSRVALKAILAERNILSALESFHAEMGDIFQIPVPGFNPIMMVGPEAARFVLVEDRDDLRWRAEGDPVTKLLRHGVLVEDGESHDELRRLMNPSVHRRQLEHYVGTMVRCTDTVLDEWRGRSSADMLVEMRRVALLILTDTLFDVEMLPVLDELWQPILRLLTYISPGPWIVWRGVPRPGYRRAIEQVDGYLYRIIAERRRVAAEGDDLLSTLVNSGMPDDLIRDQLLTMLIAGHDTSTALMAWSLYFLARHPDVQARAQQEVDRVLGDAVPTFEQVRDLHYLDQISSETLRLYPPIHLGSRIAARDLTFQGYTIPEGRRILYSIYLTHRHPDHWEAPATFDPDRFARERSRPTPYSYLPFGGGPRNCIGTAFAQVEAKVILARLLQRYTIADQGRHVHPHMGATLEPRPGVHVALKRRDGAARLAEQELL